MTLIEPEDNQRPDQPSFLRGCSTELMAGATFTQARDHILLCEYVDSLTATQLPELKQAIKQLSALYTNTRITAAKMARQEFGRDGV